ncbi:MAG: tyrosine--tRNA ligase [Bacteroidetes bacterium]|nr:tyrosine--tRNA ligase [Bacteroidota bacterium]
MESVTNIFDELNWRGLINQSSDATGLKQRVNSPITTYAGFDPTADSLHIGNLIPLVALMRFQKLGHHAIAVAGGGTGLIGDPSGKEEERKLSQSEIVADWTNRIKGQLEHFLDFNSNVNPAKLVNNYDWISEYNLIEYLRDIGKYFTVNWMLAKDSVKVRVDREDVGISYTEFSYMIIQAIDFLHLKKKYNCELQIGGSDQWGNMTAGMELIKRKLSADSYCMTFPLILTSSGKKFGKTEKGTIWLDAERTTPYQFYQFWLNTTDEDVTRFLKYFTFLTKEKIDEFETKTKKQPQLREAQKALGKEMTIMAHGESEYEKAIAASKILFEGSSIKEANKETIVTLFKSMEHTELELNENIGLVDLLIKTNLCKSKREARQDIENGAIYLNSEKIKEIEAIISKDNFVLGNYLILRRGQKNNQLVKLKV